MGNLNDTQPCITDEELATVGLYREDHSNDDDYSEQIQHRWLKGQPLNFFVLTLIEFLDIVIPNIWQGSETVLRILNENSDKLTVSEFYPEIFPENPTPDTFELRELRKNAGDLYTLIVLLFTVVAQHPNPESDIRNRFTPEIALLWGITIVGQNIFMSPECIVIKALYKPTKRIQNLLNLEKEIISKFRV